MKVLKWIKSIFAPEETLDKIIDFHGHEIKVYSTPYYQRLEVDGKEAYFSAITNIKEEGDRVIIRGIFYNLNSQWTYSEGIEEEIEINKDGKIIENYP